MINANEADKIFKDGWKEQAEKLFKKNEKTIVKMVEDAAKENKKTIEVTFLFEGQVCYVREALGKLFEKLDYFFIENKRRFFISWDWKKYEEEDW